ncbi:MAG: phage head-tail adapter protein [Ruminococcus sp.]|nr:phage head-tail adapter protein [Ruminococcus sp.]
MNKEWSTLNKTMQLELKKAGTYKNGLNTLFTLRDLLMNEIYSFKKELKRDDFNAMPYMNADGYHSKSIAYSIWHIFRIEDIVAHTLINGDEQVFFSGNYYERTASPIITTGNELVKEEISDFSAKLDIEELYSYIYEVKKSTENILKSLKYEDMKCSVLAERKEQLIAMKVVSDDENAAWLVDYWCGKDIRGLLQMPLSRHWIMHIEASIRIRDKLNK